MGRCLYPLLLRQPKGARSRLRSTAKRNPDAVLSEIEKAVPSLVSPEDVMIFSIDGYLGSGLM
jgi:hypothetical protein